MRKKNERNELSIRFKEKTKEETEATQRNEKKGNRTDKESVKDEQKPKFRL